MYPPFDPDRFDNGEEVTMMEVVIQDYNEEIVEFKDRSAYVPVECVAVANDDGEAMILGECTNGKKFPGVPKDVHEWVKSHKCPPERVIIRG